MSIQNAGALISVVSSFFLISGYLYNRIFLGAFNIDVSIFFTLTDYLASSIEVIRYSASSAAISIVSIFLGLHNVSRRSVSKLQLREGAQHEYRIYILLLLLSMSIALLHYTKESILFYDSAYIFVVIFTYLIAPWLASYFFKEPLNAQFIIVFAMIFFGHLLTSTGKSIHRLKYEHQQENYKIILKEEISIDTSKFKLITGNSTYLFFLDDDKKPFILPKDKVKYIKIEISDSKLNKYIL